MSSTPSAHPAVERDERTVAVENAGYRWACTFMSFGLLLVACFRSFVYHQSTWDLLALVILGGGVATTYQATHKVLGRRWLIVFVSVFLFGALIAAVIALVRR